MNKFDGADFNDPIELERSVQIEFSGTIYEGFIDTKREHIPFVARYDGEEIVVEIEPIFHAKYGTESVAEMCEDIRSYLEDNYS